jgi:hypothetical protein
MLLAFEQGADASPGERALILLKLARGLESEAALAALPVGRRDAALIDMHRSLFGEVAQAAADCPRCGEKLEIDVPLQRIGAEPVADPPGRFLFRSDAREIAYRLPNAGDLSAIGATPGLEDPASAAHALVARCLLDAQDQIPLLPREVDALGEALAASVAATDPLAQILLAMECPACALRWEASFDIVEFLWRRLEEQIAALLRDVHLIASRYGWRERDILALSPFRRRRYLELIGA